MKKIQTKWSFLGWLLGQGTGTGASNG